MGRLGESGAVDLLLQALQDSAAQVRRAAARQLGLLGDGRALEPLVLALADPDPDMRAAAVRALGELGDPRAVSSLVMTLRDPDLRQREAAAQALGQIGDERAVEPLIDVLVDQEVRVREAVAGALGRLGDERAVRPLLQVLGAGDRDLRAAAAEALAELGAVEPLLRVLAQESEFLRGVLLDALGIFGDTRAVELVLEALERRGRSKGSKASEPGSEPAIALLVEALASAPERLREAAAAGNADPDERPGVHPDHPALPDISKLVGGGMLGLFDFFGRGQGQLALEGAFIRPRWPQQRQASLEPGRNWTDEPLDDQGWSLQRHTRARKTLRLVNRERGLLIGTGADEDFLRYELHPLYAGEDGFVAPFDSVRPGRHVAKRRGTPAGELTIAHLSDLHVGWRKQQTFAGRSMQHNVLQDLAESLLDIDPDYVFISGDLTDNGLGYVKVLEALWPFASRGRLLVVPGNHDLNGLGSSRAEHAGKIRDFEQLARRAMGVHRWTSFVADLGPLVVAGLDTTDCDHDMSLPSNAIGRVREEDLEHLAAELERSPREGKTRVLLLHHHLEVPPANDLEIGTYAPALLHGMQLSNAHTVELFCRAQGFSLALHGHVHVSFQIESNEVPGMQIHCAPSATVERCWYLVRIGARETSRERIDF